MLDYVYRDQAQGIWSLGRAIDCLYLNRIGWRGIRARRTLLVETLLRLVEARRKTGLPTHIVDIAAGPGRYLLEMIAAHDQGDLSAHCRDLDPARQQQGRTLARDLGLRDVSFARGDATAAEDDLATLTPCPQIVVTSGIYEILTDDAAIQRSMRCFAWRRNRRFLLWRSICSISGGVRAKTVAPSQVVRSAISASKATCDTPSLPCARLLRGALSVAVTR